MPKGKRWTKADVELEKVRDRQIQGKNVRWVKAIRSDGVTSWFTYAIRDREGLKNAPRIGEIADGFQTDKIAHLMDFYPHGKRVVPEEEARKGLGGATMDLLLDHFRENGLEEVTTHSTKPAMQGLLKKKGFIHLGNNVWRKDLRKK